MLQQSVDALFDNGRCRRPVLGSSNRPLKSLTDMIKGKQGRFRENLLGKRVDYSARSVIVVGPRAQAAPVRPAEGHSTRAVPAVHHPPLKELGHADTIKSAKKMLERKDEEVWDILEEVIQSHPVLLNRAPTLHRVGIQAFEPVLVEGNAIKIHPLVCAGFNADFDGDQMAVHLPLSFEAQIEASTLMLSINNIFSPAHGGPIIAPNQDIVLGCYFLTLMRPGEAGEGKIFGSTDEVWMAYSLDYLHVHAKIKVLLPAGLRVKSREGFVSTDGKMLVDTTPGRIVFNGHPSEGDAVLQLRARQEGSRRHHRRLPPAARPQLDPRASRRPQGDRLPVGDARGALVRQGRHARPADQGQDHHGDAQAGRDDPERPHARHDHRGRALPEDHRRLDALPRAHRRGHAARAA
jgi:DNA-directed RNA polymerase subunit beta'